jgi:hypothetical protein
MQNNNIIKYQNVSFKESSSSVNLKPQRKEGKANMPKPAEWESMPQRQHNPHASTTRIGTEGALENHRKTLQELLLDAHHPKTDEPEPRKYA